MHMLNADINANELKAKDFQIKCEIEHPFQGIKFEILI